MIGDYFEFLKKVANKNPSVKQFQPVREVIGVDKGFIRFIIEFRDNSELHIFEYVDSNLHRIDYSYHWQNKDKILITRWDSAPHHPEIKTFPHHVHERDIIKTSDIPTFVEILKRITEKM